MASKCAVLALVLCCAAVSVQGRLLQQVNQRCPAGCAADGCVLDSTSGGYKCIKCQGLLTVNADDGTCGCPAGRYATLNTCVDCDKGSYCLGGTYTGENVPAPTPCPGTNQLTTIGKRSTSLKACGECSWGSTGQQQQLTWHGCLVPLTNRVT